jgi:hypothetical protein
MRREYLNSIFATVVSMGILFSPLTQADNCPFYAVHDGGLNNSQLFTVDSSTLEVNALGPEYAGYDLEALDIDPLTGRLYAASGDDTPFQGYLYEVDKSTGDLSIIGPTGCREVDALSFHPNGELWGWAQDCGLLTIDKNSGKATVILAASNREVEDMTWNEAGDMLYAVENMHDDNPDSHGADENHYASDLDFDEGVALWAYNTNTDSIDIICPDYTDSLIEIEALETYEDDVLLVGFHGLDGIFNVGVINATNCPEAFTQSIPTIPSVYNDIEGIAWEECKCPPGSVELLAKFEWSGNDYVFEKPAGNENLITLEGDATGGRWSLSGEGVLMSALLIKGGTETGEVNISGQTSGTFTNEVIPVNGGGNTPDISNMQFMGCYLTR